MQSGLLAQCGDPTGTGKVRELIRVVRGGTAGMHLIRRVVRVAATMGAYLVVLWCVVTQ